MNDPALQLEIEIAKAKKLKAESESTSEKPEISAVESVATAVKNFPKSTLNLVAQGVQGLSGAARGIVELPRSSSKYADGSATPEDVSRVKTAAYLSPYNVESILPENERLAITEGVVNVFKDRYGSWAKAKQTFADDPAGFLTDLSSVLSGGGAALSTIPKMANVGAKVSRAGNIIDPLNALTKGVGKVYTSTGPETNFFNQLAQDSPGVEEALLKPSATRRFPMTAAQAAVDTKPYGLAKADAQSSPLVQAQKGEIAASQKKAVSDELISAAAQAYNEGMTEFSKRSGILSPRTSGKVPTAKEMAQFTGEVGRVLYPKELLSKTIPTTPELKKLLTDPYIQAVMGKSLDRVRSDGYRFGKYLQTGKQRELKEISLAAIKTLSEELNSLAVTKGGGGSPISEKTAGTVRNVRNKLNALVEGTNLAEANAIYADLNTVHNRVKTMRALDKSLKVLVDTPSSPIDITKFSKANENQGRFLKNKLGTNRFKEFVDILTPQEVKAIENVKKDLYRLRENDILSGKKPDSPDIKEVVSKPETPNLLVSTTLTIMNFIAKKTLGAFGKSTSQKIAEKLLSPETTLSAIKAAKARKGKKFTSVPNTLRAGRPINAFNEIVSGNVKEGETE